MLKQLRYILLNNFKKFTKKLLLFTILCEFLTFSLSFKQFVKNYDSGIQKDTNYQISIISPLNLRDVTFNNYSDYLDEISSYLDYSKDIAENNILIYEYVTNYKCPIVSIDNEFHLESSNSHQIDKTMDSLFNDIYIKGVSSDNFIDLLSNKIQIIEGNNNITVGKKCIVSSEHCLADENGNVKKINVGDYIPISILKVDDDGNYEMYSTDYYEVIGKYETINDNSLVRFSNSNFGDFKPIYINDDDLLNMLNTSYLIQNQYHDKDVILSTIEIEPVLIYFSDLDTFLNSCESVENSEDYLNNKITYKTTIDDSIAWISINDSYVMSLDILANIFIVIIPILFILSLFLNYLYDLKEMMIYVSLGQDKKDTVLLFQTGNTLIILIGMAISILSINLFNNYCQNKELIYNFNFNYMIIVIVLIVLVISTIFEYFNIKKVDFKEALRWTI